MAQIAKLEAQAEIKSSADTFYGFFKNNMKSFVQILPQIFKSIEVVGGGSIRAGCVTSWKYDLGTPLTCNIKIQALDDENKSISFLILDGDVLKQYKSFKAKLQAIPTGSGCIAKWTIEYEKVNANAPDPHLYADAANRVSKGIDAHLART